MVWIVVQAIMLRTVVFLHVLYFIIGLIAAVLAMRILIEQKKFPVNLFLRNRNNKP